HFEAMVTKECDEPIRKLRTDNRGEYMSKDLQIYLTLKGIEHQLTVPHSPQQNGVAERLNRTLMESARAMLSHANLLKKLWAEAVATAAYLTLESYHHIC
ncbi:MAG: integrase core domain-containing protein, partial [Proteobacteria bacterium]|nr:integrase core domain-containing protein [Pseudomonadota bacterium]